MKWINPPDVLDYIAIGLWILIGICAFIGRKKKHDDE